MFAIIPWLKCKAAVESRKDRIIFHKDALAERASGPLVEARFHFEIDELNLWLARLENNHIIKTSAFYRRFGRTKDHIEKIFGTHIDHKKYSDRLTPVDRYVGAVLADAQRRTHLARMRELRYRLNEELHLAAQFKHAVIFNTLTVAEWHMSKVFSSKAKAWPSYIRRWKRACSDHRYFAVIERGTEGGRLHIHAVHFCRSLGSIDLRDPNFGAQFPAKRELDSVRPFWRYGTSTPRPVRFSQSDFFGQEGWRWPVVLADSGDFEPLEVYSPAALAAYMSKYVLKAYSGENGEHQWRSRISHQLGIRQLNSLMYHLQLPTLSRIARHPLLLDTYRDKRIPPVPHQLVKKLASKEWYRRVEQKHPELMRSFIRQIRKQPSLTSQLENSIRTITPRSFWSSDKAIPLTWRNMVASDISVTSSSVFDAWCHFESDVYARGTTI